MSKRGGKTNCRELKTEIQGIDKRIARLESDITAVKMAYYRDVDIYPVPNLGNPVWKTKSVQTVI